MQDVDGASSILSLNNRQNFIMLTRADGRVIMATPPLPALSDAGQAPEPGGGAVTLPGASGRAGAPVTVGPGRPGAPRPVDCKKRPQSDDVS